MEKMNAFIIDDEEAPRKLLRYLLKDNEKISVVGEAERLIDGLKKINELSIDVLFLDIEMPENSGLEILHLLNGSVDFEIIFVTAYSQYAINAFKLSAFDYLLKPIQPEELESSISRLFSKKEKTLHIPSSQIKVLQHNLSVHPNKTYYLRTHKEEFVIPISSIMYLEADGMYTNFVLIEERITASKPLKEVLKELPACMFRTHRSFAVNIENLFMPIRFLNNCIVLNNNDMVPLSANKKENLISLLNKKVT
jgi:two-component system LytT family response regulator